MKLLARFAAALVTGGALAQIYGLHPLWWLAWLAPMPLLIAAMSATRRTAFALGALAGALSVGGLFSYLLSLAGPEILTAFVAVQALLWGIFALLTRLASERLRSFPAVFVFPASIAAIETLTAQFSPHGSFYSLAYSQMDFLPVIQLASVGGAPAVTFLVTLFASAAALAIWKRKWPAAVPPLLIVMAGLGWGSQQLQTPPSTRASDGLQVAMIANDRFDGVPTDWRPVLAAYQADTERMARAGRRLIVLPEKIAALNATDIDTALAPFAEIARQNDVVIVLGVDATTANGRFNRAYVFRPDAETLAYDKRHMIPGLESEFAPGRGPLTFEHGASRFGVAICKDMDFPALGRGYPGARVLLVPAWDFGVDAWMHSRMAMLRGVENGYTIVRSARQGVLTVSDRYGRVLAEEPSSHPNGMAALAPLGAPGPTLYERIGDSFGQGTCGLALLLLLWTLFSRRRAEAAPEPEAETAEGEG